MLKKQQAWTGLYAYYDESDTESTVSDDSVWDYIPQECSFLLFIAKDGVSMECIEKTASRIRKMRVAPIVPLFLFDLYGDSMQIQRLISGKEYFYEILPDGSVHTNSKDIAGKNALPDLEKLFSNS